MIITCPHCQTKYQVSYDAIGSAGRKVQCAHCQQAWNQHPLDGVDDTPEQKQAFEVMAEDALDDALVAEAQAVAAEVARKLEMEEQASIAAAGTVDPAVVRNRQRAFTRRQTAIAADLPLARLRRTLRITGFVLLAGVLVIAYHGRMMVVERFPAMAGVYETVGLGVNVVGLDFTNVTSLHTLRDGKDVLIVSAQIVGLMPEPVRVPPVVVTLIDSEGQAIYEWSVTPSVRDLMAGERSTFDTQLTLPPGDAARVRLSFAGGQRLPVTPARQSAPAAQAPSTPSTIPEHH